MDFTGTESHQRPRAVPWRLLLVGAIGGTLSGMFGVGGGILMVPLLMTLSQMDQRRASATSLVAIAPTAMVGSVVYATGGRIDWLAAIALAAGGVAGSLVGTALLRKLSITWLRWLFIAILLAGAVRMLIVVPPNPEGARDYAGVLAATIVGFVLVGGAIGVAAGLLGIGGGVLAVPILMAAFGMGDLTAKGTSLVMMIPTSIMGSWRNSRARLVEPRDGLLVGVTASGAAFGGVAIAHAMTHAVSSVLFAALLLAVAGQLTIKAVGARR